jgi:hypothetical protein
VNGAISVRVIAEFLELCEVLDAVVLQPGIRGRHLWKFSASGEYTTSSAYKALLVRFSSNQQNVCGNLGLLESASSLYGLWNIIGAGLLTGL